MVLLLPLLPGEYLLLLQSAAELIRVHIGVGQVAAVALNGAEQMSSWENYCMF